MQVEIIETKSLGNRGYLVHDGKHAIAIDVQRDYQRWIDAAKAHNLTITHVLETHIHNDYVTGGYKLSRKIQAEYFVPAGSDISFKATSVSDNDKHKTGDLTFTAIHTPGHTPNHMSYAVSDSHGVALFSGGGVLYGTVGRPDLVSDDMTKPLAASQYDSAQKLKAALPETTLIYPTHGFGSFCASSPGTGAELTTLSDEIKSNIAYNSKNKREFVDTILSGLEPYPTYYKYMASKNRSGPDEMAIEKPRNITKKTLEHFLVYDGAWVIDIRDKEHYAKSHPKGSVSFGLSDSFATYIGWVIPWGDKLLLIGNSEQSLEKAQIQLGRIGMDEFVHQASDDLKTYLDAANQTALPLVKFSDIPLQKSKNKISDDITLVDTRSRREWSQSHISGAINIPFHDILSRHSEIDASKQVWVHCASGYRSSVVAGVLDKLNYNVVAIDDDFNRVQLRLLHDQQEY